MRKAFSAQLRLDAPNVSDVPLDFTRRDEIVPILQALQHIYGSSGNRALFYPTSRNRVSWSA